MTHRNSISARTLATLLVSPLLLLTAAAPAAAVTYPPVPPPGVDADVDEEVVEREADDAERDDEPVDEREPGEEVRPEQVIDAAPPSERLAVTGAEVGLLAAIGAVLIGLGALTVQRVRSRRAHD